MFYQKLTKREKEVIDYVMCGLSNDEIARLMFLCSGRIGAIVNNLYFKYEIDTPPKRVKLILKRFKELGIDYNTVNKAVF
jgi:DNA-binding NarL/FixJ family response regulator